MAVAAILLIGALNVGLQAVGGGEGDGFLHELCDGTPLDAGDGHHLFARYSNGWNGGSSD